MRPLAKAISPLIVLLMSGAGPAPSTQPSTQIAATQPATRRSTVLEPVKEGTTQPATAPAAQFGDGVLLEDLVGMLDHEKNGSAFLVLEYAGKKMRMPILPNKMLARMESAAASDRSARFRVTGRTTSYRGRNHILVENAAVVAESP